MLGRPRIMLGLMSHLARYRPAFSPTTSVRAHGFLSRSLFTLQSRHTVTLQFFDPCSLLLPSSSPLPLCAPQSLLLSHTKLQKHVTLAYSNVFLASSTTTAQQLSQTRDHQHLAPTLAFVRNSVALTSHGGSHTISLYVASITLSSS